MGLVLRKLSLGYRMEMATDKLEYIRDQIDKIDEMLPEALAGERIEGGPFFPGQSWSLADTCRNAIGSVVGELKIIRQLLPLREERE